MSPSHRHWMPVLAVLVTLAMVLGCSLPQRLLGDAVGGAPTAEIPGGEAPPPAADVPPPEPLVVTHQGDVFQVYALDGGLRETRPAAGLDYARPNTAQVVGESIYYVDSSGSSLGGVVRRFLGLCRRLGPIGGQTPSKHHSGHEEQNQLPVRSHDSVFCLLVKKAAPPGRSPR